MRYQISPKHEKEYREAVAYAEEQRELREIEKIKHKYDKKKPMGFDKKMFIFEMIDFIAIEIFAMFAMIYLRDSSSLASLFTLITPVVGGVVAYKSYTNKATAQNTKGGITYDIAMKQWEAENQPKPVDSDPVEDPTEDSIEIYDIDDNKPVG